MIKFHEIDIKYSKSDLKLFLTPALIIAQFTHITPYFTHAQCSGKPLFFPVPVLTNFWPPRIFFVKTQRIRNKPSNFTNFLLCNQIILHKRSGNQSSRSTKSLHWLISFAACSLISGQHGRLNNFCSNMLKIMFFCTFRLYHEN